MIHDRGYIQGDLGHIQQALEYTWMEGLSYLQGENCADLGRSSCRVRLECVEAGNNALWLWVPAVQNRGSKFKSVVSMGNLSMAGYSSETPAWTVPEKGRPMKFSVFAEMQRSCL